MGRRPHDHLHYVVRHWKAGHRGVDPSELAVLVICFGPPSNCALVEVSRNVRASMVHVVRIDSIVEGELLGAWGLLGTANLMYFQR
jgi:hypothetical protein